MDTFEDDIKFAKAVAEWVTDAAIMSASILFVVWLALSAAVAIQASARGHNGFGWFLLSLGLSPFFSVVLLAAAGPGGSPCPQCRMNTPKGAKVCGHCGARLSA